MYLIVTAKMYHISHLKLCVCLYTYRLLDIKYPIWNKMRYMRQKVKNKVLYISNFHFEIPPCLTTVQSLYNICKKEKMARAVWKHPNSTADYLHRLSNCITYSKSLNWAFFFQWKWYNLLKKSVQFVIRAFLKC